MIILILTENIFSVQFVSVQNHFFRREIILSIHLPRGHGQGHRLLHCIKQNQLKTIDYIQEQHGRNLYMISEQI